MTRTRIFLATALAAFALFGATALAGTDPFPHGADFVDYWMTGEPAGTRNLTADELAFDPVLDADILDDPAIYGTGQPRHALAFSELDFDWIFDDDPICPMLTGTGRYVDVAGR